MAKTTDFDWMNEEFGIDADGNWLPGRGPKQVVEAEDTDDVEEHKKGTISLADIPAVVAEVMAADGPDDVRIRGADGTG